MSGSSSSSSGRPMRGAYKETGFYAQNVQEKAQWTRAPDFEVKVRKSSASSSKTGSVRKTGGRGRKKAESSSGGGPGKALKPCTFKPKPEPRLTAADLAADSKVSYVNRIPTPPKLPPKQTWKRVTTPITERQKVPHGWTSDEIDLDPDDLDAQIARCRERMKDNIMVDVYKWKLEGFQKQKNIRREMMAKEPGLSWPVVQRLQSLEFILGWLQNEDDPSELIGNVKAIMADYRSGELDWNEGLVTYWSYGTKLCEPRPFRWHEFNIINHAQNGHTGFWVEGLNTPAPASAKSAAVSYGTHYRHRFSNYVKLCLRIPAKWAGVVYPHFEFPFIHDTGAEMMCMFSSDVFQLLHISGLPARPLIAPPLLGAIIFSLADGSKAAFLVRGLEVNMLDDRVNFMTEWQQVQVAIKPGDDSQFGMDRLDGPWVHKKLYTGTSPDCSNRLWVSNEQFAPPVATKSQMEYPLDPLVIAPTADIRGFDLDLPAGK